VRSKKGFFIVTAIIAAAFSYLLFFNFNIAHYFKEFLTDARLFFNYNFYQYMIQERIQEYTGNVLFFFGLFGILIAIFKIKKRKSKNEKGILFLFASLFGTLFYFILASKAMFFHNYYYLPIVFLFSVASAFLITEISKKTTSLLAPALLIVILTPWYITQNKDYLSENKASTLEANQYIKENTTQNEKYIHGSHSISLTLLNKRTPVGVSRLNQKQTKNFIQKHGLKKTMESAYNIKYMIINQENPDYDKIANLFDIDDTLSSPGYRRGDYILSKIYDNKLYYPDTEKRSNLIEKFNIKDKFYLEKKVGDFWFYRFKD
jgi:hypothetical protein